MAKLEEVARLRRITVAAPILALVLLLAGCTGSLTTVPELPSGVMTLSIDLTPLSQGGEPITHGYVTLTKGASEVRKELKISGGLARTTITDLYVGPWQVEVEL